MTEKIFLLEKTINEQKILNLINNENLRIFSLDYESHHFLENLDVVHTIGDTFLTNEILQTIDDISINTTEKWHENELLKKDFNFNGVLLPHLLAPEFLIYFRHIFLVLFTVIEIINQINPKTIFCSTSLNDFILQYCKMKNIKIQFIENDTISTLYHDEINIKFNILKIPISFTITRKKYFKLLKIKKLFDYILNLFITDIDKSKKSILLLSFDSSTYEELLIEFSKLNLNILLFNPRKPVVSSFNDFKIIKKTKSHIIDLNIYKKNCLEKIDYETEKLSKNLDEIWQSDEYFQKFFSINDISFWNSIKKSFIQICNSRFLESIERILLLNEFFNQNNISSILEWAEVGQEEQECIKISKKFGIPTVMLQHGKYPISKKWIPFAKFLAQFQSSFISDKQADWGNFTKNHAIEYGHNKENLIISGSPRHDKFFNFSQAKQKSHKILFATTGPFDTSADTSTTSAKIYYENFVKQVCKIVSQIPDKKLIIKPHPSSRYTQETMNLLKEIDSPFEIVMDANLPDLISQCDMVITFNNSTIALESIILGVPVISIQTGKWAEEDEIAKMNAVLSVSKIEQLEKEINKVLFDKPTKKLLHENGLKFLESYMAYQGKSSKNLAQVMNDF